MKYLINLLVTAVAAYLLSTYVFSSVHFDSFKSTLIFAFVLGLLNTLVKPILSLFTFPINFLTLGLFSLVINAIVISMADYFIDSMSVESFWSALFFSIALSIVSSILNSLIGNGEEDN